MLGYADMSTKPQRRCQPGLWTLILAMLLFALTLTGIALLEAARAQSVEDQSRTDVFLVKRLWSHFKTATNETGDEVPATVERIARNAKNASSNNYYEEQRAVVVNSETAQPIVAQRQDVFSPPGSRADSYESEPFYDAADDYGGQQSAEETYSESDTSSASTGEGRAASGHPYDSYYGQWQYASKKSPPASGALSNNRKLQPASNRAPYPPYDDVYDYPMGFQPRPQAQGISKQDVPAPINAVANAPEPTESTLVTILKSLKQIWDLYQALTSAWNAVSQRHQESTDQLKKERLEKQRLRQQQQQQKMRINSKKPGDKSPPRNQNKKAKGTSTTSSTSSTTSSTTTASETDASEESTAVPAVGELAKTVKEDIIQDSSRQKRESEPEPASSDVGEGRYIKGDPLKGYYDFVITEGSYKFWAVFQVGTALLIIYSTFAAIYYSKVNPLTSDYDYTDYLGAGRSLSGGDDDFVDDTDPTASTVSSPSSRLIDWIFILDAIDKIPLDHDQKPEKGWSAASSDAAPSDLTTGESR